MNFVSKNSANVVARSLRVEDLHSELQGAVLDHPLFGTVIDHPLLKVRHLNLPFPESLVDAVGATSWEKWANIQFAWKQGALKDAIAREDWGTYVFTHERPYRFEALNSIINDGIAPIDQFWPLVRDVWCDSENIWQDADEWLTVWRKPSRRKRMVMSKVERDSWRTLPDNLTIYRGVSCEDETDAEFALMWGQSWTLNREKAIWFANRKSHGRPFIAEAGIRKKHCFAYFSGRQEDEVVIDPDHVLTFEMTAIPVNRQRRKKSFG